MEVLFFMGKRNLIADAFFECVSSFSERTGAYTFDSRAERGGVGGKGDLTKMVCLAEYEKFDLEYTYSARSMLVPGTVSIFDIRVIFDRQRPEIKYSLYDIMYMMDPENFRCYHFAFIETPERMRAVFASIERDLEIFVSRLDIIASQKPALLDLEEKFKDGVNSFFGYDIFTSEDEEAPGHDLYLSALEHYYSLSDSFYEAKPYAQFLSGQYKKAYAGMSKYRKKTYYQVRLTSFVSVPPEKKYDAVAEGCDTVGEAVKTTGHQNLRVILGALILFIPLLGLHVGAHFLYAKILFSRAVWSTAYTLSAAFGTAPFVLPFAVALSYIFSRFTIKLFSKKKRAYLNNLENISPPFSRSGCARFIIFILLTALIILSLLNVNSYTAFYEDGFRFKVSVTDISGSYYSYSDIREFVKLKGEYDDNGNYNEYVSYVIVMKNGTQIYLQYEVPREAVEEKIVPILESKGVPMIEVHDRSDIRSSPVQLTDNI